MWFVWGGGTLSLEGHHNFEATPKNGSLRVKRLCCVFKCLSVTSRFASTHGYVFLQQEVELQNLQSSTVPVQHTVSRLVALR